MAMVIKHKRKAELCQIEKGAKRKNFRIEQGPAEQALVLIVTFS